MGYDAAVELEAGCFEAFTAARVAAVEDRHIVFLSHCIDGVEERQEVLLRVDILLAVGREEDIFPFFKTETAEYVGGFDVGEVVVQHFCHRGTANIRALRSNI